jgi:exodeoxyribonuclease V beta subunit
MEVMQRGVLSFQPSEARTEKERKLDGGMVSLSHYGAQEKQKCPEGDEQKDYDAILFGTALHYLLEMMGAFDLASLEEALDALRNRYGALLQEEKIEAIRRRAVSLIDNEAFQKLLEGAEVSKEQSIAFEGELKQIDLLLEYEDRCLVVDYKSSTKHAFGHQRQVAQYQKAVEKITGKKTGGLILYLLEEETVLKNLK